MPRNIREKKKRYSLPVESTLIDNRAECVEWPVLLWLLGIFFVHIGDCISINCGPLQEKDAWNMPHYSLTLQHESEPNGEPLNYRTSAL